MSQVEGNQNPAGAPRGEGAGRSPFRSLRRLGAVARRPEGNGALTAGLEADAMLLREENARLRVKLEAPPSVGQVIEHLRALPSPSLPHSHTDDAEHAWQTLTDLTVMRNSLIEICHEVGQVMAGLEQSLRSLSLLDGPAGDGSAGNGNGRNGSSGNGDLEKAP